MKTKVIKAVAKGLLIGATLITVAALTGCMTTTTYHPDGSVTVTEGIDPATASILATSASEVLQAKIIADK